MTLLTQTQSAVFFRCVLIQSHSVHKWLPCFKELIKNITSRYLLQDFTSFHQVMNTPNHLPKQPVTKDLEYPKY